MGSVDDGIRNPHFPEFNYYCECQLKPRSPVTKGCIDFVPFHRVFLPFRPTSQIHQIPLH